MSVSCTPHSAMTASMPFSRIGSASPMQKTHVRPASRMYASLVARSAFVSLGVGRPNSPRRSECPMSTVPMPMSLICSTAISPVYAPQPLKLQFCGATWMPFGRSSGATSATCRFDGQTYTSHFSRYLRSARASRGEFLQDDAAAAAATRRRSIGWVAGAPRGERLREDARDHALDAALKVLHELRELGGRGRVALPVAADDRFARGRHHFSHRCVGSLACARDVYILCLQEEMPAGRRACVAEGLRPSLSGSIWGAQTLPLPCG